MYRFPSKSQSRAPCAFVRTIGSGFSEAAPYASSYSIKSLVLSDPVKAKLFSSTTDSSGLDVVFRVFIAVCANRRGCSEFVCTWLRLDVVVWSSKNGWYGIKTGEKYEHTKCCSTATPFPSRTGSRSDIGETVRVPRGCYLRELNKDVLPRRGGTKLEEENRYAASTPTLIKSQIHQRGDGWV